MDLHVEKKNDQSNAQKRELQSSQTALYSLASVLDGSLASDACGQSEQKNFPQEFSFTLLPLWWYKGTGMELNG